jgi:hypothetical protein
MGCLAISLLRRHYPRVPKSPRRVNGVCGLGIRSAAAVKQLARLTLSRFPRWFVVRNAASSGVLSQTKG